MDNTTKVVPASAVPDEFKSIALPESPYYLVTNHSIFPLSALDAIRAQHLGTRYSTTPIARMDRKVTA